MATLYEYYNIGDNTVGYIYSSGWKAQTFTPSTAHKITSVKLLVYRYGLPGIVTVSIRATDGDGHPTGGDLCVGTTNGNTLPIGSPYEWREITLGDGYDLDADTQYAIVVRALSGTVLHYLLWRRDMTDPTYAGGAVERSDNAGADWETWPGSDAMFEDWGAE